MCISGEKISLDAERRSFGKHKVNRNRLNAVEICGDSSSVDMCYISLEKTDPFFLYLLKQLRKFSTKQSFREIASEWLLMGTYEKVRLQSAKVSSFVPQLKMCNDHTNCFFTAIRHTHCICTGYVTGNLVKNFHVLQYNISRECILVCRSCFRILLQAKTWQSNGSVFQTDKPNNAYGI
jgi:hypothetical protein